MFFYLIKLLFSGDLQFKDNFVCGQNNPKYRDWAPLKDITFSCTYKEYRATTTAWGNRVHKQTLLGYKDPCKSTAYCAFKERPRKVQRPHSHYALLKSRFNSTVTPNVHTNPSRERRELFDKALKPEELKMPALPFSVDGKHFENGATLKRWCHDNHVTSMTEFYKEKIKFLQRGVDVQIFVQFRRSRVNARWNRASFCPCKNLSGPV